jgi:protein gp37
MSDGTLIEWTDATWNVINGCSVVSPGCTNCYAMKLAGTRLRNHPSRQGLTKPSKAGPVWTGETRFNEPVLTDPLKWKRPRKIFVCAHGDLFHESVPFGWIDRVFAIMALASQHVFQVLTKRPDRMREYFADPNTWGRIIAASDELKPSSKWNGNAYQLRYEITTNGFLPNVWLGTSVEDQPRADERVPHLLSTPAAVRWISAEPLLGYVHFGYLLWPNGDGKRRNGISALIGEPRLDPAVVARMGLTRAKRLGEVGARGGGTDSSPRIGTPPAFRELLLQIARSVHGVPAL